MNTPKSPFTTLIVIVIIVAAVLYTFIKQIGRASCRERV